MPNLYGDILSDVAAQIAGSVGLAGSANIGESCAMFEAIHGSAPRRAGKNLANPSGLLMGAVLMLVHIDEPEVAAKVHNAWLRTIEDGVHTYDIYTEGVSTEKVGTREFASAVIERLGQKPNILKPVTYARRPAADPKGTPAVAQAERPAVAMELKGIDVFVYWPSRNPNTLADAVGKLAGEGVSLQMIDNRGVKVWPAGRAETFCTDSFRCRFMAEGQTDMGKLLEVVQRINGAGIEIAVTETLRNFDGQAGYTLAQGQSGARPSAGGSDHGQQVGLVGHASGRPGADQIRGGTRMPGAFGAPHAEGEGGVCERCRGAGDGSDRRRGRRGGAFGGGVRGAYAAPGAGGTHGKRRAEGFGFAAFDGADAGRDTGGDAGDWRRGGTERGAAGGGGSGQQEGWAAREIARIPRGAEGQGGGGEAAVGAFTGRGGGTSGGFPAETQRQASRKQ